MLTHRHVMSVCFAPDEGGSAGGGEPANGADNLYETILSIAGGEEPQKANPEPAQTLEEEGQGQGGERLPESDPPPAYKVKIDGEEREVTLEELLRGYQRQADYTRKTQELAEGRRQMEQERMKAAYDRMPVDDLVGLDPAAAIERVRGQVAEVDARIRELEAEIEKSAEEHDRIPAKLSLQKEKLLRAREELVGVAQAAQGRMVEIESVNRSIFQAIPDFAARAPKLREFVSSLFPEGEALTARELQALTDPRIMGPMAAKLVRTVNALYERTLGAAESAREKIEKKPPAPLNRPGAGHPGPGRPALAKTYLERYQQSGDLTDAANWIGALVRQNKET